MEPKHAIVAIVPCNDLDESQAFYERLGFKATAIYEAQGYRILHDRGGATLHLTATVPGWVVPDRNPGGLYFYSRDVEALAAGFGVSAHPKPWGLIEFAVSDPNGMLVRIGWPA
jgi:catechol 2,3-dioxygenase-like lactoylglutathione lyase family enzyme